MAATRIILNLTSIVSVFLLARLLAPDDFGLVAIATAISTILMFMTEMSLSQSLINLRDPSSDHYNTAFTLNFARGIILSVVLAAAAIPIAELYDDVRLAPILLVIAASVFVSSFGNPKMVIFNRNLDLRPESVINVLERLVSLVVAVAIAFFFRSYWALIISSAVGQILRVVLSYVYIPFSPRIRFNHWRKLLSFSVWLTLTQAVHAVNSRSVPLIIGAFLPTASVGQYSVASRAVSMPIQESLGALQSILFPAFTLLRDDISRLAGAYLRSQSIICMVTVPACFALVAVAEPLFADLLLGSQWRPAVPLIQAIALGSAMSSIQNISPLALAVGKPNELFYRSLRSITVQVLLIFGCLWAAPLVGVSQLAGVGAALALSLSINSVLNLWLIKKLAGIAVRQQLTSIALRPIIAATLMLGAMMFANQLLNLSHFGALAQIGLSGAIGAIILVLAATGLWALSGFGPGAEREIIDLAKRAFSRFRNRRSKDTEEVISS